ncbi:hypothetical protein OG568_48520 (plasmid) [Streptomyces sp. NBC_01450]|uniref:hypothetical protein n=1 Tax=Streptomyces sp. NBC_01450 TaxID=2903871 RepID=UPI002E36E744|nr:hypothetical protein [Streptomyces sp. NBC_01450]
MTALVAALSVLGVSGAVAEALLSDGTGAAAALRKAAASGEWVEVLDERAEYSTTYANPDGYALTLEQSVVPVRVARPDGSWVAHARLRGLEFDPAWPAACPFIATGTAGPYGRRETEGLTAHPWRVNLARPTGGRIGHEKNAIYYRA